MEDGYIERWRYLGAWLILLLSLVSLGGCLVTVEYGVGGTVTSSVERECFFNCAYNVGPGEDFERTFTAVPTGGWEFHRWRDSLGDGYSVCTSPLLRACPFTIVSLPELLDPFELTLEPFFLPNNGFRLTRLAYTTPTQMPGAFRQVSLTEWEQQLGSSVFRLVLENRTESSVSLSDASRKLLYVLNLGTSQVNFSKEGAALEVEGGITAATSRPTGWLVNWVSFGNSRGQARGEYRQVDEMSWQRFRRNRDEPNAEFVEEERGADTLVLRNLGNGKLLEFNFTTGDIRDPADEDVVVAVIQDWRQAVNGWNAYLVQFADMNSGEDAGAYVRVSEFGWEERGTATGDLRAQLVETRRDAIRIDLRDTNTGRVVQLRIRDGFVAESSSGVSVPIPKWDIVEIL